MKLGILGSGMIVNDLLSFLGEISGIELQAIASTERSYEKCLSIKEKYNIKKAYKNYSELLDDSDVDVVYVGIPNFLHYEVTKKALEKNKHVICEKPFTSNDRQLRKLIEIAKNKKLILLEAISNIYLPNVNKLKECLKLIGDIKIVSFNYSQYSSRYDAFKEGILAPVFDINKDGGALVDLNIYNIHLISYLFGIAKNASYHPNIENNIDTSGIMVFDYDKFKAIAIGSKDSTAPTMSTIQADYGSIVFDSNPNDIRYFDLNLRGKDPIRINVQDDKHRLYYEFLEFEKIIREKDYKKAYEKLDYSLDVLKLITKARKDAGIIYQEDKN